MSQVIDAINNNLIPLLDEECRRGRSNTIIEGIAQAIADSAKEHGIRVSVLNLGDITSELWQEYIKERMDE